MSTIERDLATTLEEGSRLRKLGIDQEELDAEICNEITEVVSQRAWFATNDCNERFHIFVRSDRGIEPFHSDDTPCDRCEFFLPLDI